MRRTILTAALVVAFAAPALAVDCVEADGTPGVYINTVEGGDASCQTAAEYAAIFSIDNLIDAGVVNVEVDMGDGTTVIVNPASELEANPLDRPVAANPSEFEDAPTVGEILYPATATRLDAMIG